MKSLCITLLAIGTALLGFSAAVGTGAAEPRIPVPLPVATPVASPAASSVPGATYFGGTTWDAADGQWEALPGGTWTFDSGVGSSFDHSLPGVNPFKDPARHALMEGWLGKDRTFPDPDRTSLFRRISAAEIPCAVIGGSYSLHAGVSAAEADTFCYGDGGPGYGNGWDTTVERTFYYSGNEFDYQNITMQFDYAHEIENGFDYVTISVGFPRYGTESRLFSNGEFTGTDAGSRTVVIDPFLEGPAVEQFVNEPVVLSFRFQSDGAYSDEDGVYPTACGGFSVDNLQVSGGGIAYSTDFESDNGGWTLRSPNPGAGGDYSDIVALADIDTQGQACASLQDSVLVFVEDDGGHNRFKSNFAMSPWVDLAASGLVDHSSLWVEFDIGASLPGPPATDYNYVTVQIQSMPAAGCSIPVEGDWVSTGFVYPYPDFTCDRFTYDLTNLVAPGAERVRVALGIISYCNFYGNCSGASNSTPWFDNVRVGVAPPEPEISLLYDTLSFQVPLGSFAWFQLGIGNAPGAGPLTWEITEDPIGDGSTCPWLTPSGPPSGIVGGGDFEPIDILVDALGLAPGLYSCDLAVLSNDPQNPSIPLTVTMEVVGDLNPAVPGSIYATQGYLGIGELLQIDASSGATFPVGWTRVQGLPGLAINAAGEMYGVGGLDTSEQVLYRIDAQTGGVLPIGDTGAAWVQAMAFGTDDDVLYCLMDYSAQFLATVDLVTGAATPVLELPVRMAGMAFDPTTGELFVSEENGDFIYKVIPDPGGGPAFLIPIGSLGLGLPVGDLCFDGTGNLYGVIGEDLAPNSLVLIDKVWGAGAVIGTTGFTAITGLALRPDPASPVPDTPALPSGFALHAASPNPFNPATRISFDMPESGRVTIAVYDSAGRRIRTILDEVKSAGAHEVTFRADQLASGVYFYEMRCGDFREIRKATLLK